MLYPWHGQGKKVDASKKASSRVLYISLAVIAGILICSAIFTTTGFSIFNGILEKPETTSGGSNAELVTLAYNVLGYLDDGDYNALSTIAHPEYGIVFSPYATINLFTNKCFQANQIAALGSDNTVYVWGVINGSGEPIEMTPADYFAEIICAGNYIDSSIIGINHIVKTGNALENITEIPGIQFVDFHLPGNDHDPAEDFEWRSLRLGFEDYEGSLRLTLILNSKWTG